MSIRRGIAAVMFASALLLVTLPEALSAQTDRFCDGLVATIVGTAGDDVIMGTSGPDVIAALQGDDVIDGLAGDDVICAGVGNDVVRGGEGFDVIFGAQGNDTIFGAIDGTPAGRSDVRGGRIFGGAGNDIIVGTTRWDRMQGGPGEDRLSGFEGRDWMRAGPGADIVDGGAAIDDMHGGNGADVISTTAGDIVRGGAGLDRCDIGGEPKTLISCGRDAVEVASIATGPNAVMPVTQPPVTQEPEEKEETQQPTPTQPPNTVVEIVEAPPTPEGTPERAPVNEAGVEPGSGTPDLDTAFARASIENACDVFTTAELSQIVRSSSNSTGLFAELPAGLGDGSDLSFDLSSSSKLACEWFSDPYIWFVGVTVEAADPTFVDVIFGDRQTFGDGYTAAILSDTSAMVVAGDLLIRVSNLPPLNSTTSKDRAVTRELAEAIGVRLR